MTDFPHAYAFGRHFGVFSGTAKMLDMLYAAGGELVTREALTGTLGIAQTTLYSHTTRLYDAMEPGSFHAITRVGYRLTTKGLAECAIATVGAEPPKASPLRRHAPPKVDAFWTDERLEILKARFAAGDSFSRIAAAVGGGCSRNAALGKAHRIGLNRFKPSKPKVIKPMRAPPVKPARVAATNAAKGFAAAKRSKPAPAPKPKAVLAGNNTVMLVPPSQPPRGVLKAGAFEPLAGSLPRPLLQRPHNGRRWPVGGEGVDLLACCEPTGGATYCQGHRALAYQPPKDRDRWDKALDIPKRRRAA